MNDIKKKKPSRPPKPTSPKSALKKRSPEAVRVGKKLGLDKALLLKMHDLMVTSRVLEERLIKIYKAGESYFWIGAPGEEAFGVALGLLVKKGNGPKYDYLHLHYRGTPTVLAMGMPMVDSIRLMMNKATDPSTGGRNFSNHYCFPKWNVVPVGSPIEIQYQQAIGTAWVQRRTKTDAITIVTGGDAGTAEGDFASCLVWSSRKDQELPIFITVQNNRWGISTSYDGQHGETHIADRGKAFNMRTAVINGNDVIESYLKLGEEMAYIREKRKPVLLEAEVSRLYGHSSASGANFAPGIDPVKEFEKLLIKDGILKEDAALKMWAEIDAETKRIQDEVRLEPNPTPESVWDHVFADGENADWRKF